MKEAENNVKQEIIQRIEEWGKAVESGDERKVMAFYEPGAVLWGTLSRTRLTGRESIITYFEMFCHLKNIRAHDFVHFVRQEGGIAVDSGSYVFSWQDGEGNVSVPARFTFVMQLIEGRWMITEHHSSLFPSLPFDPDPYLDRTMLSR